MIQFSHFPFVIPHYHTWARGQAEIRQGVRAVTVYMGPDEAKNGRIGGPTVSSESEVKVKCSYRQFIREFL